MRINSILLSVAVLAAVGARTTAMAEAIRCLTGNSRPAARVAGTYTIFKAGLLIPGFPASDTPEETKRSFASGRLTDGNTDTLFEWPDREFGKLGRDIEVDLGDDYLRGSTEVRHSGLRVRFFSKDLELLLAEMAVGEQAITVDPHLADQFDLLQDKFCRA